MILKQRSMIFVIAAVILIILISFIVVGMVLDARDEYTNDLEK